MTTRFELTMDEVRDAVFEYVKNISGLITESGKVISFTTTATGAKIEVTHK